MKLLDGSELAGYITERQARQVRSLRQAHKVFPRLSIIVTGDNPVIEKYVKLKSAYGEDILVEVDIHRVEQSSVSGLIDQLNNDDNVHGIVLQLPLEDVSQTDELVSKIAAEKDVDGLGPSANYVSATATAIDWLLAGYNIQLSGRAIAIVGQGRLVGAPLLKLWQNGALKVEAFDDKTVDLASALRSKDVIVTATGVPRLITSSMIAQGAVVVDAGTASENGVLVGDVSEDVRDRADLTITPIRGGVGPLTIVALFDNVIQAARATVSVDADVSEISGIG